MLRISNLAPPTSSSFDPLWYLRWGEGTSGFFLTDWLCTCSRPRLCSALTSWLLSLFFLFRAPLYAHSQLFVLFKLSFLFVLMTLSFFIALLLLYTFSLKGIFCSLLAVGSSSYFSLFSSLFRFLGSCSWPFLPFYSTTWHMVVRRSLCLLRIFCS
jgi:hypothetical protein